MIRAIARLLAVSAVLTMAAACGSAAAPPSTSGPGGARSAATSTSTAAGTGVTVTVPGLSSSASAVPTAPVTGVSPSPATPATGSAVATGSPSAPAATPGSADGTVTASENSSAAPPVAATTHTAQVPATSAPSNSTARPTPPSAATAPTGIPAGGVPVNLSNCAGCTVVATHRNVNGTLSAALATTAKGAVLLSVRPDGSPAGVINVPYGATFPTPAGGTLPCDAAARCIVTGRQSDGTAILSAFELTGDGAWRDMSGNDAFPSATPKAVAADVNGDGLLEIAVQESGDGRTTWLVFGWSGDRFTVLGCAPASDTLPSAGELAKDVCLS